MNFLTTVGDSLQEGFFMFWETLWALVLGFTLSGAVQSFVSRAEMQKAMGDHKPRTIVKTSLLGAASSSCSYAASALSKSLFQRGADFTSSMVFMFASTNLVLELGIILWLLMGWQFAAAEFVGGAIMITLFTLLAPRIFPAVELEAARERLNAGKGGTSGHEGHAGMDMSGGGDAADEAKPFRERLRSKAGWADAAGYTVSDLTMLRRELVIGYVVAGVIAVAVPTAVFKTVFLSGHGILTDLENVVLGPIIAFVSFVCSIGNVPLAASLYKGGISFGGTVAFIFADLIALPLVVIYGKFYGRKIATRLFLSFWLVMSVAGLAVDLLFRAVGIGFPKRPIEIAPTKFEFNYTMVLNILFLGVAAVVYWTYRNRERFGAGGNYAKDPVCGMQVERDNPGATTKHDGHTVYFCADRCKTKFDKDPAKYDVLAGSGSAGATGDSMGESMDESAPGEAKDPVCGMKVDPADAAAHEDYAGQLFHFCSTGCQDRFAADPLGFLAEARDPVCGMTVEVASPGARATVDGRDYIFCMQGCAVRFAADPAAFLTVPEPTEVTDPVCGMSIDPATAAAHVTHDGHDVAFCSLGCRDRFVADPAAFTSKVG
jgi:YHS domain-containing protein/uncharacterized membrane protein YraQ (UPF0718 family)